MFWNLGLFQTQKRCSCEREMTVVKRDLKTCTENAFRCSKTSCKTGYQSCRTGTFMENQTLTWSEFNIILICFVQGLTPQQTCEEFSSLAT